MRLLLILLFPALLFSQDFRKMSFGQTTEELKETYSQTDFDLEEANGITILSHDDLVGGITTTVAYLFVDNSLMAGAYTFDYNSYKSSDDRLKDYKQISRILNEKYEMKDDNTWHNDSYKNDSNSYSHALAMGYVDFGETYKTDKIFIRHTVQKSEGAITHILGYSSPAFVELMYSKSESDF